MKTVIIRMIRTQASITAMKALIKVSGLELTHIEGKEFPEYRPRFSCEEIARMSVGYADALIAELKKKGGTK
nr:MAG TPA: hypothetical protein [Caudoviricetes sp.]